jgi:ABC-type lipoprotein release transport system permease subunit
VSRALRVSTAGGIVGAATALAVAPRVQPLLFDNSARDPTLLACVVGALFATCVAASLIPSFRALRVDPLVALRAE